MSDLKQTIKKTLTFLALIFVVWFLWELIGDKDLYTAAKAAFEVFSIAFLCVTVAEAAIWYQTKKSL